MDQLEGKQKLLGAFKKYRFALLIFVVGLVLMLIPSKKETPVQEVITQEPANILSVEEQLAQILSLVEGAGKVQVMLMVSVGEETLYQTDTSSTSGQDSESLKQDTVTVTDSNRTESGLVRQVNPPVYSGAIIVCQGADSASVRLSIVDAVADLTGLGADRISVLKMK